MNEEILIVVLLLLAYAWYSGMLDNITSSVTGSSVGGSLPASGSAPVPTPIPAPTPAPTPSPNPIVLINQLESVCKSIPSCTNAAQLSSTDWNVSCKGQSDNTLHMNSATDWLWMKGYNTATFARHTTPAAAISAACPPFTDPSGVCSSATNCFSTKVVNIPGYGASQYAIKCVGDSDYTNTLLGDPNGQWSFYKGYNSTTFNKYPNVTSAVQAYCNSTPRAGAYNH